MRIPLDYLDGKGVTVSYKVEAVSLGFEYLSLILSPASLFSFYPQYISSKTFNLSAFSVLRASNSSKGKALTESN